MFTILLLMFQNHDDTGSPLNTTFTLVAGSLRLLKTVMPEIFIVHFVCCLLQILHVRPGEEEKGGEGEKEKG